MGLVFYALQRKQPGGYEPGQIKELKATEMVVARASLVVEIPPDSGTTVASKPDTSARAMVGPDKSRALGERGSVKDIIRINLGYLPLTSARFVSMAALLIKSIPVFCQYENSGNTEIKAHHAHA